MYLVSNLRLPNIGNPLRHVLCEELGHVRVHFGVMFSEEGVSVGEGNSTEFEGGLLARWVTQLKE